MFWNLKPFRSHCSPLLWGRVGVVSGGSDSFIFRLSVHSWLEPHSQKQLAFLILETFWASAPATSQVLDFATANLGFSLFWPPESVVIHPSAPKPRQFCCCCFFSFSPGLVYVLTKFLSHFSGVLGGSKVKSDFLMCAQHFSISAVHPHPSSHLICTRAQWTRKGGRFSLPCLARTLNMTLSAAFKRKWARVGNRGEGWFHQHCPCFSMLPMWNLLRSEMPSVMWTQWEEEFGIRAARNPGSRAPAVKLLWCSNWWCEN